MMRGIIVVITAIFSVVFLKRKLYCHHWVAVLCIVFGVAEVGLVAILNGSSTTESGSVALGIVLLLIS